MDKKKQKEIAAYLLFGLLTTAVSIGSFQVLHTHMKPLTANVLSWILSVGFAYVTNRRFVFDSNARGKGKLQECFAFYAGRISTLLLEELLLYAGIELLKLADMPVKIAAQFLVIAGNYIISKRLIFRS